MFCSKCGEKLGETIVFCPKCGTKVVSDVSGIGQSDDQVLKYTIQSTNGNSGHIMNKKMIISIGGLLLCVLFFVAPLVQCSQDSSLSATGLEISTSTGKLMGNAETCYPYVFVLLILPVILVILGFIKKSFSVLRNVSIGGLVAHIIFMIGTYAMLNSGDYKGAFELTGFNWLIIVLYIGIIGFSQYCIQKGYDQSVESNIQNNILDPKKDGLAIASLISGITGLSLLPIIGSIVGIVTGVLGLNSAKRKMAIAGLIISIIGLILIIIAGIFVYIPMLKGQSSRFTVEVVDPSSPYVSSLPTYSWYTDIGRITTLTSDDPPYMVEVTLNLGYDLGDIDAASELKGRRYELMEFVRGYFSQKNASELQPRNEESLKREIREQLNTHFLNTAKIRNITFTTFSVTESSF